MKVMSRGAPFGSDTRTRVLVLLARLQSSYARELARLLDRPLSVVQKALASLERDGLVAAQTLGRIRLFRLNPAYFARPELERLLVRLADADPDVDRLAASVRRRPRRAGKPL